MIKGVYHCAFRCRDTEETRQFYEDFLGLRFARSLRIAESKTEPHPDALMTSYEMGCGSYLAFWRSLAAISFSRRSRTSTSTSRSRSIALLWVE